MRHPHFPPYTLRQGSNRQAGSTPTDVSLAARRIQIHLQCHIRRTTRRTTSLKALARLPAHGLDPKFPKTKCLTLGPNLRVLSGFENPISRILSGVTHTPVGVDFKNMQEFQIEPCLEFCGAQSRDFDSGLLGVFCDPTGKKLAARLTNFVGVVCPRWRVNHLMRGYPGNACSSYWSTSAAMAL